MELHHSSEPEAPEKVTKLFLNTPLDPRRTCREADRQATGAVVLLPEVLVVILRKRSAQRWPPAHFPHPLHAPGAPRLLRRNSPVPLLRAGPDRRNKT